MAKKKVVKKKDKQELLEGEELEALVAVPHILKDSEGKEYALHPLDVAAMAQLRVWAKKRISEDVRDTLSLLGDDAPKEIVDRAWNDAYEQMKDPLTSEAIETPEAIQHWIYISIKKGDASVTEEIVSKLIREHNIKELMAMLMALNGITKEDLENPRIADLLAKKRAGR